VRELDAGAEVLAQPADHVVPDELRRAGKERLFAPQPRVRGGEVLVGHADALVHDRDEVLVTDPSSEDLDGEVGR
jgi:hypothetical protein